MIERTQVSDGVVELRLARPAKRNALSLETLAVLRRAIVETGAGVIVLSGEGPGLTAGADFADLDGSVADTAMDDAVTSVIEAIGDHPGPVVAAVHGFCAGAGVAVVAACDLVIAEASAWFQVPATRLGLLYDPVGIERIANRVSPGGLATMLLVGDRIEALSAQRVGLVDIVVDLDARTAARDIATRITANDQAATAATTKLLRALRSGAFDPAAWQSTRRDLLSGPTRRRAIAATKNGEAS